MSIRISDDKGFEFELDHCDNSEYDNSIVINRPHNFTPHQTTILRNYNQEFRRLDPEDEFVKEFAKANGCTQAKVHRWYRDNRLSPATRNLTVRGAHGRFVRITEVNPKSFTRGSITGAAMQACCMKLARFERSATTTGKDEDGHPNYTQTAFLAHRLRDTNFASVERALGTEDTMKFYSALKKIVHSVVSNSPNLCNRSGEFINSGYIKSIFLNVYDARKPAGARLHRDISPSFGTIVISLDRDDEDAAGSLRLLPNLRCQESEKLIVHMEEFEFVAFEPCVYHEVPTVVRENKRRTLVVFM